jgi:hypothetical protein
MSRTAPRWPPSWTVTRQCGRANAVGRQCRRRGRRPTQLGPQPQRRAGRQGYLRRLCRRWCVDRGHARRSRRRVTDGTRRHGGGAPTCGYGPLTRRAPAPEAATARWTTMSGPAASWSISRGSGRRPHRHGRRRQPRGRRVLCGGRHRSVDLRKKVLLPAGVINYVDTTGRTVHVDRTKEQIKNGPEFDQDAYREDQFRNHIGDYYAAATATSLAAWRPPSGRHLTDTGGGPCWRPQPRFSPACPPRTATTWPASRPGGDDRPGDDSDVGTPRISTT